MYLDATGKDSRRIANMIYNTIGLISVHTVIRRNSVMPANQSKQRRSLCVEKEFAIVCKVEGEREKASFFFFW